MELLTQRLASLLTVKSLVTVILTAVFAAMAGTGRVTAEQFLTVFTVVIAFTSARRRKSGPGNERGDIQPCPGGDKLLSPTSGCGSSPAGTGQTW